MTLSPPSYRNAQHSSHVKCSPNRKGCFMSFRPGHLTSILPCPTVAHLIFSTRRNVSESMSDVHLHCASLILSEHCLNGVTLMRVIKSVEFGSHRRGVGRQGEKKEGRVLDVGRLRVSQGLRARRGWLTV